MQASDQSFLSRLFTYQKERFPLLVHIPLIAAFSFSAIGFSRACRGLDTFIDTADYMACVCTNFVLFFMLRVADEHKDKINDALYRKYLPVPRGLITLRQLFVIALMLFVAVTVINAVFYPQLIILYSVTMFYLLLMRYEFFIPHWLKKHQVAYVVSHMMIIPLADVYASGYDWRLSGAEAPSGLLFFFIVSFLNGIVMEVGRKIKISATEEYGVVSYTKLWGRRGAPLIWLVVLTANLLFACIAINFANYGNASIIALLSVYAATVTPALLFIVKASDGRAKAMEIMALVWALCMYLILGGIPMLLNILNF